MSDTADAEPAATPPKRSRRLILIAATAGLLLAGGGAAWLLLPSGTGASVAEPEVAYILLDPIVVNLRSADGRPRLLRVKLALEIAGEERREAVQAQLPRILDAMLMAMRELTPDDAAGAAGLYRIKEELLARAHVAIGPGAVRAVLVQEVVQQ